MASVLLLLRWLTDDIFAQMRDGAGSLLFDAGDFLRAKRTPWSMRRTKVNDVYNRHHVAHPITIMQTSHGKMAAAFYFVKDPNLNP